MSSKSADATPVQQWQALTAALRSAAPASRLAAHLRVARGVSALLADQGPPPGVERISVALLRSVMAEPLIAPLTAQLADVGFAAAVHAGQLGNIAAETLAPDSFVYGGGHSVCVVFALAQHVLPEPPDPATPLPADAAAEWLAQIEHLAQRFAGVVLVCNLAPAPQTVAPHLLAQQEGSLRYAIADVNRALARLAMSRANLVVVDVESLAAEMGGQQFWSSRDLATSLQPLSAEGLLALAARLADAVLLYRRTPIKCLVLDCDNTLWGGVVGEDGLTGIHVGETYPGWCFQQFQRQLVQLNRLGFLLALNSKNNEADVREVFEKHRGMVLKLDHIAALRVNWQDKVANLQELAEELNLGLDSFVFIDDSDYEVNLVRERLPQVRTVQTPHQPWQIPGVLRQVRGLDRLKVTSEDRKKALMYAQERQREGFRQGVTNLEEYLRGLQIVLTFERFNPDKHLARAAQLTQKTNQFNLTTRRFGEADLRAAHQQGAAVYLASLKDRFGEYGRIAMALIEPAVAPGVCDLAVFLMSCRVIGRGVEDSFLRLAMQEMQQRGFERMTARFIPTARNAVSKDFLARAGLQETSRDEGGVVHYDYLFAQGIRPPSEWLRVEVE